MIFETQSSIVNPGLFSECTQMMFSVGASVCNVWLHLPKTSWLDWHLMAMVALIIKLAGRFPCGFDDDFQVSKCVSTTFWLNAPHALGPNVH